MTAFSQTLGAFYDALNRNDLTAALDYLDPEIVRIEPPNPPTQDTTTRVFRGHAEMLDHLKQGRSTWAEGGCQIEKFETTGGRVIVWVHVQVRLKDQSNWLDGHVGDVFTFRGDKIIEMRTFWDPRDAIAWAQTNPLQ